MPDLYRPDVPLKEDAAYRVARHPARGVGELARDATAWATADEITWGPRPFETTFSALWNEGGLAVRFQACDTRPWHTMRVRDDSIYEEEVVEVFLDPAGTGRDYAEVEISPANVVTDLHVIQPAPLKNDRGWDWAGLETVVRTASRAGFTPDSWEALAWLPWEGLRALVRDRVPVPPAPGDRWRFNVFRIKRPHGPADPERGAIYAAWSAPGGATFHAPAAFRDLHFLP